MLEIIAIWALCKKIATIVKDKGRRSGGYIALTIGLWIAGEIIGAIIGAVVAGITDGGNCLVYAFALIGAAAGGATAYAIARAVPDLSPPYQGLPKAEPAGGPVSYELPAVPRVQQPGPAAEALAAPPERPAEAAPDAGIEAASCPSCGYLVTPADRFCPSCGSQLAWEEEPGK